MGIRLTDADEGLHEPGDQINWNESRYVDFWDPTRRIGGWFRIGARPNAHYAEMSACVFLPDSRVAFAFDRAEMNGNALTAGGQAWEVVEPWRTNRVRFDGAMSIFDDPWVLTNPKKAFASSPQCEAEVALTCTVAGLDATMGQDQDQHRMIFLPGQADFHYQHMAHVTGTIRLGDETFEVDGRGAKDHSWGPRNWHAKIYLRWLICCIDDDNGFMLTRAVGPTAQTRSGFVLTDGRFSVVDGFDMTNHYAGGPNYELLQTEVVVRSDGLEWSATGVPQQYLPLRHRQRNAAGVEATLRIVKQPTDWRFADGRTATGHLEYHDLVEDGVPVGLHE
jgi:hypothetical protein